MRGVRERIRQTWRSLTIQKKIAAFTGAVFLIILLSVVFDIWVVRFSLVDFNQILQDNAKSSELMQAVQRESSLFESYKKNPGRETWEQLSGAMEDTKKAVEGLPFSYRRIGEERYARTWSILNSYEVYCQKRDEVLGMDERQRDYIASLYEVYEMQDYLQQYARVLMLETIEDGSRIYQEKVPRVSVMPAVILIAACVFLGSMAELAALMNRTIILPVVRLVRASHRIAANDFFVEDVQAENEDELGELVHSFNKMKYATGEYILALEEKRKTLDLLHERELASLDAEKRLEMMKLEVLRSQINPHFLFNTLNVIGGMANLEEAETTEKMIKALSSLFRYNLKTTELEVPLASELKVVTDYMYLQQMRFGSRIAYEVDCRVDEERVIVPTFTLQPLVENAIIHGLSHKEEGGRIRILIRERDGGTAIVIGDNGVGMEPERLWQLREELRGSCGTQVGIGLGNISKRMQEMWPGSEMHIYSKPGAGTVISVLLRARGQDIRTR